MSFSCNEPCNKHCPVCDSLCDMPSDTGCHYDHHCPKCGHEWDFNCKIPCPVCGEGHCMMTANHPANIKHACNKKFTHRW